MVEERMRCTREFSGQWFADLCWSKNHEATLERRHRVLLGLERGSDPKLLCTLDLFNPRKRP
jgi:hypothetical protein